METISIIIPVYNDSEALHKQLQHLANIKDHPLVEEVLVVDASDVKIHKESMPTWVVSINSNKASRAVQMNIGASQAKGDVLYFVHADSYPPLTFPTDIINALKAGHQVGGYRMWFVPGSLPLRVNSWATHFHTKFSGGGDQTLYIPRAVFEKEGGFNEEFSIMEDFELTYRLTPKYGYHIIPKYTQVSSRKYFNNSYLKVSMVNYKAFRMFEQGVSPDKIKEYYQNTLR
ncbi:glycosyltransferase family 2 protein [Limibacter armeniacum]|uniref:TIGR04283 family arsenosugar biosynthesis glycosyltransferase n=1 Tax=Limibacter armeniacum TaxID=466084 RepID=UPI002FE61754